MWARACINETRRKIMLVMGICNPANEVDGYHGLCLTQTELRRVVRQGLMQNLPVKTEHCGSVVGSVISAFIDDVGQLIYLTDSEFLLKTIRKWTTEATRANLATTQDDYLVREIVQILQE